MDVELVNVQTADEVRLDGYFRTASSAGPVRSGLDLIICHHGVGGNFYGPSFFDRIGDSLREQGCAVLRVNNRGHDQAYHTAERRLGAAYEVLDDCRLDLTAWLDFAEARGFWRIALWGHSLGAVKTIYFLAAESDPRVICAVASSPPRFSHAAYLESDAAVRFKADIERARQLIDAGHPEDLLEALIPQTRVFSARTYFHKYGPADQYDYFKHLPRVRVPLLLTLGGLERENLNFTPLAERGPSMNSTWPNVSYTLVDGADHSYTDRIDNLWDTVRVWLNRVKTPRVHHPQIPATARTHQSP